MAGGVCNLIHIYCALTLPLPTVLCTYATCGAEPELLQPRDHLFVSMCQLFDSATLKKVLSMYAIDYVALNLQLPLWVDSFNGLATKGQMLQAASKIIAENPKLTPDQAEKLKRCFEQRGRS